MKKKNTIPKSFDDILGSVYTNADTQEETTVITEDDLIGQIGLTEDDKDEPHDQDDDETGT